MRDDDVYHSQSYLFLTLPKRMNKHTLENIDVI